MAVRNYYLLAVEIFCFLQILEAKFGVNIGICDPLIKTCKCGESDINVHISVDQCTYHKKRLRFECRPCHNKKVDVLCEPFAKCLTCDVGSESCSSCPQGFFGRFCEQACNCQNGGDCNKDGLCICPSGFYGAKCQIRAGCPSLAPPQHGHMAIDSETITLGTSAKFHCNEGFKLIGQSVLYCLDTQQWSSLVPQCLMTCPVPIAPAHGFVQGATLDLVVGASVIFSCQPGYALQGSAINICLQDGTWSEQRATCIKISFCEEPNHPENSERHLISGLLGDFSQGTQIKYQCREGSQMLGSNTIECKENGKWSAMPPVCITGTMCKDPGQLENGQHTIRSKVEGHFPPGSSIEYRCDPLFYLKGCTVISCNGDGNWSAEKPSCMKFITCQELGEIPYGNVEMLPPSSTKPLSTKRITGQASVVNSRGISRLNRRRLKNSTMLLVDPLPTTSTPIVSSFSSDIISSSSVTPSNYRRKRQASPLPSGHYHIGSRAEFSCESRYYKLIGSKYRTCQEDGTWSGRTPTCIPVCGVSNSPKIPFITHGIVSKVGEWPWQVGISTLISLDEPDVLWFLTCGGSLINERWVMTAAHCVTEEETNIVIPKEEIKLYFGKYYRNNSLDDHLVQKRNASEVHVHPDYQPKNYDADIALIRLSEPIEFSSRVQPICLPEAQSDRSDERLVEGNKGMLIGWGITENGGFSGILRHVSIPVVNSRKCEEAYRNVDVHLILTSNTFCAGYEEGKHDSCSGDSGGPLVFPFDERQDKWVQEGIVSWGSPSGCGGVKQYSGFTRVQRFLDWIHQYI